MQFGNAYTALTFCRTYLNDSAQFRGRNSFMKNLINRFAMMAVLGSLVCGVLVAGCGGGDTEEETTTKTTTTKNETED